MFYNSWTKLEDKTYLLGGLAEKEKPRSFIRELLKEAEQDLYKRTGSIESVFYWDASQTPVNSYKLNEIVLPNNVGRIKNVQLNGLILDRFNSDRQSLNNDLTVGDGSPSAWNMKGDRIITFDTNLDSSDYVAIFYEATNPSPSLFIKGYSWLGHGTANLNQMVTEPHADLDFAKYWNGENVHCAYETSGTWAMKTVDMIYGLDADSSGAVDDDEFDLNINSINSETPNNGAGPMPFSSTHHPYSPTSQYSYHLGDGYQKFKTQIASSGSGQLDSIVFPNYRESYGPTCPVDCQSYLPYYALGLIGIATNPEVGEYFMQKWLNYTDERREDLQDNDLPHQIVSKTRDNWRI